MTLSDWIISISATVIAALMGLLAFLANKLYDSLAAGISDNSEENKQLAKKFDQLKSEVEKQAVEIPDRVTRSYETADKIHQRRVTDGLEQSTIKIQRLEVTLREKVFPQVEKIDQLNGKVTVLEQSLDRLLAGLRKMQKPPQQ